MRLRFLALVTVGLLGVAGPAFAGSGASGGSSASAGGSHSTGSSSSSSSISTSGSSVGVVQGNVTGGSSASGSSSFGDGSGSQSGGASSGGSGGGQTAGAADHGPSAVSGGTINKLNLPAIGTAAKSIPASHRSTLAVTWALAAVLLVGLVVLYRRFPRTTPTQA